MDSASKDGKFVGLVAVILSVSARCPVICVAIGQKKAEITNRNPCTVQLFIVALSTLQAEHVNSALTFEEDYPDAREKFPTISGQDFKIV